MPRQARVKATTVFLSILICLILSGIWLARARAKMQAVDAGIAFAQLVELRDSAKVESLMVIPPSLVEKTPLERKALIFELLTSEISSEGAKQIASKGQFGPLKDVFPNDAAQWAAGVPIDDCVAFRMEREGIRAELVLLKSADKHLVLRCNNVRQMAGEISQP